ncbi:MAG: GGDEF domain-containing protein [Deltaproteobacteria bacterium]|nr:GGDEF domain-containing protein [Deltaproteobacteria bacterium]
MQRPKYRELPLAVRRKSWYRGVAHALILVSLFLAVELSIYFVLCNRIHQESDQKHRFQVTQLAYRFESLLSQLKTEFQILANSEVANKCLTDINSRYCEDASSLMKTMTENNENMDHIRLIDLRGFEIVRVNRNSKGEVMAIERSQLQSKKHRPYFFDALKTQGEQVYISKLELNMENGKVEEPRKPILRLGKSIRSANEKPLGIAIANYRVTSILQDIGRSITISDGRLYLLNADGFYLKGINSESEFSFMFPGIPPMGFFSDYPREWDAFNNHASCVIESKSGIFFFQPIEVRSIENSISPEDAWVVVIHIPEEIRAAQERLVTFGLVIGALLLLPVITFLGWRNGRYRVFQQWYIEELAATSVTDDLTGVLNHRGVMRKLTPVIEEANMHDRPVVLIFVDINDLKIFNDKMGHEMGDRLIQCAAHAMQQALRKSDIVGRLGGDEFVMGLVDCTTSLAVTVMKRVEKTLEKTGLSTTGEPWTMSWGYTVREPNDTPEQMIARADKCMYDHKTEYKTGRHSLHKKRASDITNEDGVVTPSVCPQTPPGGGNELPPPHN